MFPLKSVNILLDAEENTLPGVRDPIQEATHRAGGGVIQMLLHSLCLQIQARPEAAAFRRER